MSHYPEPVDSSIERHFPSRDYAAADIRRVFDDSRIKDHPDKVMPARVSAYLIAFAKGDYNGLREFQAREFDLTDISKPFGSFLSS